MSRYNWIQRMFLMTVRSNHDLKKHEHICLIAIPLESISPGGKDLTQASENQPMKT